MPDRDALRISEDSGTPTPVDLAIVGAGPCGIAVGAAAERAGLRSVLIDRGPLCASIVGYPRYMNFFSTPEKLEIEELPFVTSGRTPSRVEALSYFRKVADYFELDVRLYEEVTAIGGSEGDFTVRTRRAAFRARRVVIATGGFDEPNLLDVPGEDLPRVSHYYSEAHPYWRQDVVVIGGSNSAVETSLELYRHGARVTLVHFADDFDPTVKPWLLPDIRNRIDDEDISVRFGHRVVRIEEGRVHLQRESDGRVTAIANDFVLALTGWRADRSLLKSLGVPVDDETGVPAHDPVTMETPVPGVHIAGVLAAGNDANRIFIENGRWHGRQIVHAARTAAGRQGRR